jgi:YVTN family beta-propeller protein
MKAIGLVALFVLSCAAPAAPASSGGTLLVLNKSDHEVAIVDPASRKVVAKLPTGRGPHEVAVSPDGRLAYVANYGAHGLFRPGETPKFEPGASLTVVDLEKRAVRATYDLTPHAQPHGISVSRDGRLVWVTVEGSQSVLELEAASGKILRSWKTGQEVSHMLVPTPDERKLYVANIGSGSVTVVDRASGAVKSVPTGAGAEGVDVSPDGREVWVTNRGANTVSVLDTKTDVVAATLESGGKFPIRIKFTPDGRQAWVSNAMSNAVAVFDVASRKPVGTIEVGAVPVGILITPDGKRAYVANTNANQVTAIDVAARRVLGTFSTGTEPDGMAWAR